MRLRVTNPHWGRAAALALALVCAMCLPALARPKRTKKVAPVATKTEAPEAPEAPPVLEQKADKAAPKAETTPGPAKKGPVKEQNFNFDGLGLNGRSRSPQLLYFLERANEELERASLEKRSFIPHLVRSLEEEQL